MCGVLSEAAELCLLSLLLLGVGWAIVEPLLVWLLFLFLGRLRFSAACLPLVTLSGFRNLSGSSWLACSCSGDLLLGWRCLWCTTWFSTLCRALPPGPAVCAGYPWGVSAFFVTGCLTYCCSGGEGWAAPLPLSFLCFSCASWLAGVCWVLHPVSGSSLWGCVCFLGDSVIALLAFPYLKVGVLLACCVCGVSCEVCSLGCPSWLVIMSLFVLHLLLCWGGLVTGLWPHLQLLCGGLFWCLCCTVLSPWLLVAPSSFSCASLGFFLLEFVGLGLVGCSPAWVPAFFWWGTLLPLSWLFSLGGSYCVVVQAP